MIVRDHADIVNLHMKGQGVKRSRPITEHVLTEDECTVLAGWIVTTSYSSHDKPSCRYRQPGTVTSYRSKVGAIRAASGVLVSERPNATAIGKYPSRRGQAKNAVRRGETHIGDTPVFSMDPRRAYSGPSIPHSGRMPAGDDLPGWEIERMSAADGKMFLLYYDPSGNAVGSRGAALKATGQLFITRSERQSLRFAEEKRTEHGRMISKPIHLSSERIELIKNSMHRSDERAFMPGEFEQILQDRFDPTNMNQIGSDVLAQTPVSVKGKVVVVDLFAGCGGWSLGTKAVGFPFVMGIDENAACHASFKANECGSLSMEQRIRERDVNSWYDAMEEAGLVGKNAICELVLLGGPPCQPYARNGQRAGMADERDCLPTAIAMACKLRPLVFLMENVQGILDNEFGDTVFNTLQKLVDEGYTLKTTEHKCKHHAVPQLRTRLLFSFTRNDAGDGSAYIPTETAFKIGRSLGARSSHVFPEDAISEPGFWSGPCPRDLVLDSPCLKSRSRIDGDTTGMAIISSREPSPTVITSSMRNGAFSRLVAIPSDRELESLNFSDLRMLFTRHGKLLQTFPPKFILFGNLTLHSSQIGNAVPPMLAYDIGVGLEALLNTALGRFKYDRNEISSALPKMKAAIRKLVSP